MDPAGTWEVCGDMGYVAGVDPGNEKCGIALLASDGTTIEHRVIGCRELADHVDRWIKSFSPLTLVLGDGTGSKQIVAQIENASWAAQLADFAIVDEYGSTLSARDRYFAQHPRRGWRRLLPVSMQTPPVPYDDYVAIILAERYISRSGIMKGELR